MIRFNDIKVVLYKRELLSYNIAKRIVEATKKSGIPLSEYTCEEDLGSQLEIIQKNNLSSKEVLILKEFHGRKFQKCPGSNNVICCNYYLLNTCFNCLYDCTYCFLNSYLNSYGIVQFVTLDELSDSINEFSKNYHNIVRVGTGEFTDSLMFDEITGIAHDLIEKTCSNKKIFLEFKTKSANIDHLLDIKDKGHTVLAWTLNTPENIKLYEHGAATLKERLDAAVLAQKAGYFTAFHFDPIIRSKNFIDDYIDVMDEMAQRLNPEKILWISLGCFRHSPGFKDIIKHKFPYERLTTEEMFPGIDGKMRYITSERIKIFKTFYQRLHLYFPKTFIYLCMEDSFVWKEVFGIDYNASEELENDLSQHLKSFVNCN